MIKSPRFVVLHKDHAKDVVKYFGPFVSMSAAETFVEELPAPMEGGRVDVKPLELYGQADLDIIRGLIARERQLKH